jgi:hypothetical protein
LLSSLHSMEERPIDMHVINIGVHSYWKEWTYHSSNDWSVKHDFSIPRIRYILLDGSFKVILK